MRELALERLKVAQINMISDREPSQLMIVRFIGKEKDNIMIIEDEFGKDKIYVRGSIVWIGMICCIETVWSANYNMYELKRVCELREN